MHFRPHGVSAPLTFTLFQGWLYFFISDHLFLRVGFSRLRLFRWLPFLGACFRGLSLLLQSSLTFSSSFYVPSVFLSISSLNLHKNLMS